MKRIFTILVVAAIMLLTLAGIACAVNIETVFVGDKGNVADTRTGKYGSVSYDYNIGKYEVTAGQYTEFLNAVAKKDTYGLYFIAMVRTDSGSGITRSGSSGNYTYLVANDFVNRPVNYVSFWDSVRFANWLQNGQKTGAQDASTTEDGAYTLTATGMTANTITRNTGWAWAVTNENEWYKAAYYKGGSTNAGYWEYATGSNTAPGQDINDVSGNNANWYTEPKAYPIIPGKYTTAVGEFQNSESPYGTFDQSGNVWEWTERIVADKRGLRGGSYGEGGASLWAGNTHEYFAYYTESDAFGFRVVKVQAVPEPAMLLGFGIPILMVGLGKLRGLRK